jgi:hypothetical protein
MTNDSISALTSQPISNSIPLFDALDASAST